jgi:hypothetical protein
MVRRVPQKLFDILTGSLAERGKEFAATEGGIGGSLFSIGSAAGVALAPRSSLY